MKYVHFAAGSLLLFPLLAGCCPPCSLTDGTEYLSLAFSTDSVSGQGFRRQEMRSSYLVRYADNQLLHPLDTLRQPTGLQVYWPQAMLSLLPVFEIQPGATTGQLPRSYRLTLPAAQRSYDVNNLLVQVSESECGCAQATLQQFQLNGKPVQPGRRRVVVLQK